MSHLRIGYTSGLLWIDIIPVCLILGDVIRLGGHHISWRAAFAFTWAHLTVPPWESALKNALFLLLLLPLVLAIIRVVGTGKRRAPRFMGSRATLIKFGHLALAAFASISYPVLYSAKLLGGLGFHSGATPYAFTPWYETAWIRPVTWIVSPIPSGIELALLGLWRYFFMQGKMAPWVQKYGARLKIADLHSDLHPATGRHTANFNTAAGAPEIRLVKRLTDACIAEYRSHIPGTPDAATYLVDVSNRCRRLIGELLYDTIPSSHRIEFYSGTSRALDVALTRGRSDTIVISPYEHPSEAVVSEWHGTYSGAAVKRLFFTEDDFALNAALQVKKVSEDICHVIQESEGSCVLLLSEVCSSTGLVIPIESILSTVRDGLAGRQIRVVIDAAHAAGNVQITARPAEYDAYVFSGHKWLFAAEPIGVIVCPISQVSYDTWAEQMPCTWSSARTIAAFYASLSMLHEYGIKYFVDRSCELKERFRELIKDRGFDVVGHGSNMEESNMISIRPALDFKWKRHAPDLRDYLRKQKVYPLVWDHEASGTLMREGRRPVPPWLRISFPYFLDTYEVEMLARAASDMVERG